MEIDLVKEIKQLKQQRDAVILAHYYQRPEIQEIADYVGDSYYLSKIAKECKEKVVVFCGVKFMAESAKILSPEKTVLLPNLGAGCPMADMCDAEGLAELKKQHPNAVVVSYINSGADVKALTDTCVTSSNAVKIINNIQSDEIIFLPDKNLGDYLQEKFPNKKFIIWQGYCITHKKVKLEQIEDIKKLVPDVKVLVHPECEKDIRDAADFLGSTGEIIAYAKKSDAKEFVVVTEQGILHTLQNENPDKKFYIPGKTMTCVNMKKTRLEDVHRSLLNLDCEISLDEEIITKAYNSLIRMHELAR